MAEKKSGTGDALKIATAAIGAVGAVGAMAAGYYFYGSKDAKTHRKIAAKWAVNMKADVIKQAKKVKDIDRKTLESIVMNAQKTYAGLKNMDQKEVARAAKELKSNWQEIMNELGKGAKGAKKAVKTAVKKSEKVATKAVSKVAKKVAKKVA